MRLARASRAGSLGEVSFGESIFVEDVEEWIVTIVRADDSDDLRGRLGGAEGFHGGAAVGPAGAEALEGGSVGGPCRAAEDHLRLDLDGERSRVTGSGSIRGLAHEHSIAARTRIDAAWRMIHIPFAKGIQSPSFLNSY